MEESDDQQYHTGAETRELVAQASGMDMDVESDDGGDAGKAELLAPAVVSHEETGAKDMRASASAPPAVGISAAVPSGPAYQNQSAPTLCQAQSHQPLHPAAAAVSTATTTMTSIAEDGMSCGSTGEPSAPEPSSDTVHVAGLVTADQASPFEDESVAV